MKAAVVVDDWKLPIFRQRLAAAGYSFEEKGAFTEGTSILHVETQDAAALKTILQRCQKAARNSITN